MQNIELYCGSRKLLSSEKVVLARVIEWLSAGDVSAIVYTNVKLGWPEIDILVATPNTTLVLEVKGFRNPVSGRENGQWISTNGNGKTKLHTNGYEEVIEAYRALKNRMERELGGDKDISYPRAAVIFEGGIPAGSDLFTPIDNRVVICGIERLGELLAHKSQYPWPLEWLRDLADELRLTRRHGWDTNVPATNQWSEARAETSAGTATTALHQQKTPGISPARSQVQKHTPVDTSIWQVERPAITNTNASASPLYHNVRFENIRPHRNKKRRLRRYIGLIIVASAAVAPIHYVRVQSLRDQLAKSDASMATPRSTHREASTHTTRHRQHAQGRESHLEQRDSPVIAGSTSIEAGALPPSLPALAPPEPITCPPGVDRLGCDGRTGLLSTPICPAGFMPSRDTCIRTGKP
ncbi:MAG TPA: nuclease-related domain-containing protein [Sphingomicrobium sp.]|nr:nuclease-related domain-containing protein [Sphingomicrobium sp.]